MTTLFGLMFAALLLGTLQWLGSRYWRYLARSYAGSTDSPIEQRSMQNAILIGSLGAKPLIGIVNVGIHDTGVSFSVLLPFSLFHTPLFIPFGDLSGWETTWYLNAQSIELHLLRAPKVKIVVPAEQAEWIRSFSGHKITLHEALPPDGKAGRVSYGLGLIGLGVVLVTLPLLIFLLPSILSK